jgi:hypothetical protein
MIKYVSMLTVIWFLFYELINFSYDKLVILLCATRYSRIATANDNEERNNQPSAGREYGGLRPPLG